MNKEAVKLYADLILEKSLTITPYESSNDISFKYEHNSIIATIINIIKLLPTLRIISATSNVLPGI